jgi:AcrR family transcriptional regulator
MGQSGSRSNKINQANQRRIPKQARAVRKYQAVLAACTQILALGGYKKLTMMELSLTSGVAVPSIYQYFPDKEAILFAWFDVLINRVLAATQALTSNLEDEQLDPQIDTLIKGAMTLITNNHASIHQILIGMPHILSTRLIGTMESRTVDFVCSLKTPRIRAMDEQAVNLKITVLVKVMVGYVIELAFNEEAPQDIDAETDELCTLVRAYLRDCGMLPPR